VKGFRAEVRMSHVSDMLAAAPGGKAGRGKGTIRHRRRFPV
jgi:hypothetical protein